MLAGFYQDMFDLRNQKADMLQSVLVIMQGGRTKRYHTHDTLKENTVAEHSWGVAMLCWLLAEGKPSANLLMTALTHDVSEKVWGDLPAPSKRALNLRDQFQALEDNYLGDNRMLFDLDIDDAAILKMADIMEAMLFCVRERKMGNTFVQVVFNRLAGYLQNETVPNTHQRNIAELIKLLWEEANVR